MRPFLLLLLAGLSGCGSRDAAELVVQAVRVEGFDRSSDAIATKDGNVVAIGRFSELEAFIGDETTVLHFPEGVIVPGFEDSHIHLLSGGLSLFAVDLFEASSLEEIQSRVAAFAAANPHEPWILGSGWQYTALPEGRLPTHADLDSAVSDRPVFLTAYDGHTGWANEAALELAGIDETTKVDGYGEIVKDPSGRPTGTLKERAMRLVRKHIEAPTRERKLEALRRAMAKLSSVGTVAIGNASGDEEELSLYESLLSSGELTVRVSMAMSVGAETTDEELSRLAELKKIHRGPWIEVVGVKIVADGVIESHTAAMLEPYADVDSRGEPVHTQEVLDSLVSRAHRVGLDVWIHAIGDRAVRMSLDAFQKALAERPDDDPGFRIEHIEVVDPEDVPRFEKLAVVASMQPIHAYPSTVAVWSRAVGEERLKHAFAWESLRASGAKLLFGTDWPASISVAPMRGIHNAVNRRTLEGEPDEGFVPAERVSLKDALRAFTGDRAAFGLADFVVLSKDPFDLESLRLNEAEPVLTVVGGRVTFRQGGNP